MKKGILSKTIREKEKVGNIFIIFFHKYFQHFCILTSKCLSIFNVYLVMYIIIMIKQGKKKNSWDLKDVVNLLFVENLLSKLVVGKISFFEVKHPKEACN